jgi:uncharacterized membrane protein YeaQ/YmgE (transglycosylase-associated protein family)
MLILNCLWVGALAGLVGSRLIRRGRSYVAATSSIAVGVLGALVGGVSRLSAGVVHGELPHGDILAAGVGAATALILWAIAQRLFCAPPHS